MLSCVVAVALWAPTASAAEFKVDTTKDRLDASPGDGTCAAASGKCSLRAAIQEANAFPGLDDVLLPKGTFELTRAPAQTEGADEGDLDLLEALVIEGKGSRKTVIRQTVKDRVFLSDASPAGFLPGSVLSRLAVKGGEVAASHGGGILARDNLLALSHVALRRNTLVQELNNTSLGGGVAQLDGTLDIQDSTIAGNAVRGKILTSGAGGGGVFVHFDADAAITDSKITGNRAHEANRPLGGAAYLQGPTEITGTRVAGNRAELGGAIHMDSNGGLTVGQSTISGNTALRGGALHVDAGAAANFTNSTVSGNRLLASENPADDGAAFHVERGVLRLISTTVADHALNPGQATVVLVDVPPAGDTQADILASVLFNPRPECVGEALIDEIAQNVLGDDSCLVSGITPNLVADPLLKPLRLNPGPGPGQLTTTHALRPSSPAIDFATTLCPPPDVDQRGVGRPQGDACDSGAFERSGP
jgi:CSLREA domain-containing protein